MNNAKLKEILEGREHLLELLLKELDLILKLKTNTRITVLVESKDEGNSVKSYLLAIGFKNVRFQIPEFSDTTMINSDLVILHRDPKQHDHKRLKENFIVDYILENRERQMLMYFGPFLQELKAIAHGVTFTTYRTKLEGNLIEQLKDNHYQRSAQAST